MAHLLAVAASLAMTLLASVDVFLPATSIEPGRDAAAWHEFGNQVRLSYNQATMRWQLNLDSDASRLSGGKAAGDIMSCKGQSL